MCVVGGRTALGALARPRWVVCPCAFSTRLKVDSLAREILANSWGTNRIDKQLLYAAGERTREDALANERLLPFGLPDDMQDRMRAGGR